MHGLSKDFAAAHAATPLAFGRTIAEYCRRHLFGGIEAAMATEAADNPRRAWPVFRSLAAFRASDLPGDLIAGLTLAAIAIPEQMATARLGGFSPQIGFSALRGKAEIV